MKLNDLPTIYLKPAKVAILWKAEDSIVKTGEKSGMGALKVGRKTSAEITPKAEVVSCKRFL